MKTLALICLLPALLIAPFQSEEDPEAQVREEISRAALDYIEAIYEAKPDLIQRSVHPQVHKVGYSKSEDEDFEIRPMSYEKLLDLAANWSLGKEIPEDAAKEVVVLDRFHDIATVKLTASWGVDYMMLARSAGRWKIVEVLYQSNPK